MLPLDIVTNFIIANSQIIVVGLIFDQGGIIMSKKNLYEQLLDQKKRVDFNSYDFSIKELISLVATDKVLNIAPDYQRQFRWDQKRQSSLVESIFLGLPIPSLFMATNGSEGNWELIDGVQRISTIIHFAGTDEQQDVIGCKDKLTLVGLKKISEFNGLTFDDMPLQVQLAFKMAVIKVISLTDKSDKSVRFDLFERLNRGGVTLTDQEIRSCVYRGEFNDFIKELSKDPDFISCIKLTKLQQSDGTKEEMVLRFFAYLNNYQNFEHSVVDFLNDYMEKADKRFDYGRGKEVFNAVFTSLAAAFPSGIVKHGITPQNLFEGLAVGAAFAYINKGTINTDGVAEWIKDSGLAKFTTGATNSRPKVEGRIKYCQERFER